MHTLEDVIPRIVAGIQRGQAPDLADAIAYEVGEAWTLCHDGEAMLALLTAHDADKVLIALRACAAARRAVRESRGDDPTAPADPVDSEARRATIRRLWADAVRAVCPEAPPLAALVAAHAAQSTQAA